MTYGCSECRFSFCLRLLLLVRAGVALSSFPVVFPLGFSFEILLLLLLRRRYGGNR